MNDASPHFRAIAVDEFFPHSPDILWKTLTNADLIGRWLMTPNGFEPVVGNRFTFRTKPAGEWDGTIRCEILEIEPGKRLVYSWTGGDETNEGYGSRLDTIVTFTVEQDEGGSRLRIVHSGFRTPTNDSAYRTLSSGWSNVLQQIEEIAGEEQSALC